MQIESNFRNDQPHDTLSPGGYQWWYFDAIDVTRGYKVVLIFYASNPFSTKYIQQLSKTKGEINPNNYPALSISIYKDKETIFYSFTEFRQRDFLFVNEPYLLSIGNSNIRKKVSDGELVYHVTLSEKLPSGDSIDADLVFKSPEKVPQLQDELASENRAENVQLGETSAHMWNLIQPLAKVSGQLDVTDSTQRTESISFEGSGYHDQNTGMEPMKDSFNDWYWGRFHFEDYTLIYYAMNQSDDSNKSTASGGSKNYHAWLFDTELNLCGTSNMIEMRSVMPNMFGLISNRVVEIKSDNWEVTIQQPTPIDNGPFYQRFVANAIMYLPDENHIVATTGFTEYIKPSRIYSRIFWPLVNMRLRQYHKQPHWVQKSPTLYRWTW